MSSYDGQSGENGPVSFPPYPSGLNLQDRRVVVVGGGHVAQRRIAGLLDVGARVVVVSPSVTPAIEGLATGGEIVWEQRAFEAADLDDTWYVIAATDVREVNEAVSEAAEVRRIFCVRSDDGTRATAWTPAVGRHDSVTVAVVSNREPRRSAAVRDAIVAGLRDGSLDPTSTTTVSGVVLVGGGPGDPGLVTLAGRRALAEADVVVADRLAPRALLAELSPDVELIDVAKLPRGNFTSQERINEVIIERARAGKRVVRFKGGDNFVFGRGYEEIEACTAAGIPVSVIPGVTSAISVPALAGIPVTHRSITHEFTVISGHLPPGHADSLVEWGAVAQLRGTVVLLMAVQNLPAIADVLMQGGRPAETPVAVISDGSMPGERVVLARLDTVAAEIEAAAVRPPAVVVIGEVVAVAHPEHFGRG